MKETKEKMFTKIKKDASCEIFPAAFQPRKKLTPAQRAADVMTNAMGSWGFLIGFTLFLVIWITLNVVAWFGGWDPYPFILLNLCLSCLSASQAPIILMSQNRQTERDRNMAQYDYSVNRKAEREIRDMQQDLEEIKQLIKDLKKS
ncbi:MAG: DUF1003 domain-containing protein [Candidatus Pacebacteria bacterium]|nr:DUF1003 domain-containing protein [Candidatus Paceibacterota bacterium]